MDIAFSNNQTFTLSLDVTAWEPVWPLASCVFHAQIRALPQTPPIIYAFSSNFSDGWGNGTITLTNGILVLNAPQSDMLTLFPGNYLWELQLLYSGFVKTLTEGACVINQGVVR